MTFNDFTNLRNGQTLRLYYNCTNEGDFLWKHAYVEGDRVYGQFYAPDWPFAQPDGWSTIGDYLYEFDGNVCRGSGAEPVFRSKQEADAFKAAL